MCPNLQYKLEEAAANLLKEMTILLLIKLLMISQRKSFVKFLTMIKILLSIREAQSSDIQYEE